MVGPIAEARRARTRAMPRMTLLISVALLFAPGGTASAAGDDAARLKAEAARVTITRDDWGIAHVHGHSDADAVFGMAYAQAEDDFNRVETNYITSLGRAAPKAKRPFGPTCARNCSSIPRTCRLITPRAPCGSKR